MEQAEGDSGVGGMDQRALALNKDPIEAFGVIQHHALGAAGEEVADEAVGGDAVAREENAGLASGGEDGGEATAASLAVQLDGDGHLADVAVSAAEVDDLAA